MEVSPYETQGKKSQDLCVLISLCTLCMTDEIICDSGTFKNSVACVHFLKTLEFFLNFLKSFCTITF